MAFMVVDGAITEIRTLNAELAEREVLAAQVVNDHCATRSRPRKWLWGR